MRQSANPKKAKDLQRFFKTCKGEYAQGDRFLGVMVPSQRLVLKKYKDAIGIGEITDLLKSEWHEERLTALLILAEKFKKGDDAEKKEIFDLYLENTRFINNWDLVDLSAPNIVGAYLYTRDQAILYELARSKDFWERRIAVLATFWFIKEGKAKFALAIAEILVGDRHDLIQKAVGWMLREIGKRCSQDIEEEFLKKHYKTMPRTMLRYAIERFSPERRKWYLAGKISGGLSSGSLS